MTFGRSDGPPATARQLQDLVELVHAAGHTDLRDARGPLGLTQRQAAGKFTRDEADAFIARLRAGDGGDGPAAPAERLSSTERMLRGLPAEQLAGELQRRGWLVVEP